MLNRSFFLVALLTLAIGAPGLGHAQTGGGGAAPGSGNALGGSMDRERTRNDDEAVRDTQRARRAAAAATTVTQPVDVTAAATTQAQAAGLTCTLSGANALGDTGAGEAYEVTCDTGVGYVIAPGTPPTAFNCLVMATNAERAKAEDPNSTLATCSLPANQNAVAQIAPFAQAAGVKCTVDQATWVGRNPDGKDRFEVGCAGADGAWVEVTQTGGDATKIECFEIVKAGRSCSFTTPAEQVATMQAWLASGETPACTVEQAKYLGRNASGRFYEAKCTGADGLIARIDLEGAMAQSWACVDATRVVGGCTMTPVAAAAAPPPAQR